MAAGAVEQLASAPGALSEPSSGRKWLFAIALIAVVFLAYQPAWHGDFIFDDDLHVLDNPVLRPGGIARTWVEPGSYLSYWPLTFTIYRLEFEIWGLNPFAFHLVNFALHAFCAILFWRVLVELDVPGAMLAAAIFALHPVNVESVAWIAQLKGILSLLFALLSTLLYLQYDRRGAWPRYAAAIVAFFLSTLSKGMLITLPVVLLTCVWWRRGSIGRRDLARMVPYVLIGALMAGVEDNLGNALAGCGRAEEAIAQYRRALDLKPDYMEAHANLGALLARRGSVDEAIDHYETALRIAPDGDLADKIRQQIIGLRKAP